MVTDNDTYVRRPGIVWREEEEARREAVSALEEGCDASESGTLIIVDSGQINELNLLGADIWKLCDGRRTVAAIVDELLALYDVRREELEGDVREFLHDMRERGWVEIK